MSTRRGRPRIGGQLVRGGGDDDVAGADGADDLGADLLVAAAQDVALAADDGDDDPGVPALYKVEDLALARVGGDDLAVSHHVDAEQGAVQAELVHDGGYGAAGAHDVGDAGLHFRGDGGCEGFDGAVARFYAAVLGGLEACVVVGHPQVAVEARGGDALARGVLVDVHHLGHAGGAEAIPEEGEGSPPGFAGGRAEDGGVYLHACGDAQRGCRVADGVEDVAGRAVSAGEEEEVDAVAGHLAGGPAGVTGGGGPGGLVYDEGGGEAGCAGLVLAHVCRAREYADLARAGREDLEGLDGARGGLLGRMPSWRARASAASPSVPFSPTRPPMPAMGLTIRPSFFMGSPRRECTTWESPSPQPSPCQGSLTGEDMRACQTGLS